MKNKKTVIWILVVLCVLVIGALIWRGAKNPASEPGTPSAEESGSASVIEDSGDLVIVIPDDQESGGL